jgi:hypothetical protein
MFLSCFIVGNLRAPRYASFEVLHESFYNSRFVRQQFDVVRSWRNIQAVVNKGTQPREGDFLAMNPKAIGGKSWDNQNLETLVG